MKRRRCLEICIALFNNPLFTASPPRSGLFSQPAGGIVISLAELVFVF
ncbi:MAG: hypothetical protein LBG73_07230 [Spirochaetaceae bacterium]|nr:hypothetical protein [Spirochaetaceae bacterium]